MWWTARILNREDAARRATETQLRNQAELMDHAHEALIVREQGGAILFWNHGAETLYGWPAAEAIGQRLGVLLRTAQRLIEEQESQLEQTGHWEGELHHTARDGRLVIVESRMTASRAADGRLLVLESNRDITARKQAEAALCDSQAALQKSHGELETRVQERTTELKQAHAAVDEERRRFKEVLDKLPAYLVLLTPDYHVPFANRFFEERFGKSNGKRCYEYLFNRTEPCEVCETYKVLKTNAPLRWEWTGPDDRNYDIHDFPFTDTDGSPLIMEVGLDITERKKAEQALQKAGAYNRSLIEASLDPLVTIGPDGRITDVNAATEAVTGFARTALIGTDFSDYFTEPDQARAGYQQVFREGFVRDYPLELRHHDGRVTSVLYNASVYRNESGAVIGVFAAARDVTARQRAEAEIQRYAAELQRSNQELEHFAYVASHDLQEPLRTVSSFSQLLARRYQGRLDADADEFIAFVVEGATRMQTLINDLLAFSRVGTRGNPFAPVNCAEVLQAALANVDAAIAESGAVITQDPLPTVSADRTQLTQLFQNLFSNAIKFRRRETAPRIHVSVKRVTDAAGRGSGEPVAPVPSPPRPAWLFSVSDNGLGIDPQFFGRIFIIFQRLHGREEYPGTGIGLAICKKIIERHGGQIWVESQPGSGSTFQFTLPDEHQRL
jgi:PAS domain S-box-containing protein